MNTLNLSAHDHRDVTVSPAAAGRCRNIGGEEMATEQDTSGSLRDALQGAALREAMIPRRPVFGNPWDSTEDMFACCVAVGFIDPMLLWCGGKLTGAIFSFSSHWKLGVFIIAAVVGAAGFMTIVGRERTRMAVDVLAIAGWFVLGLIVAPILGLALSPVAAIICYAILLAATLGYVLAVGRFKVAFLRTVSWPITWTLLAVFFAFAAYKLVLYS